MQTYTTLDHEVLDLSNLTPEQEAFFRRCMDAYREGADGVTISRLVEGGENPLVRNAGGRITRTVWEHPLFHALSDLEDRAERRNPPDQHPCCELDHDPLADDWLPLAAAARAKGVTPPGLHKAVKRGDVIAHPLKPGSTRLLVSRKSVDAWQPNRVRQAARRRPAQALS